RKDLSDVSEILNIYRKRAEESDDPDLKKILEKEKELDLDYSLNEMKELIAGIEEGARRTSEIVTGLKDFSRTDEDEAKEADINQGIRSTLTILKSELGSVSLESNLGEIPEVRCYLGKLNQVFMNILDNSIDAVKDRWGNQPEGLVKIDSALVDDQIVIRINDNGAGIPAENLRNIFDPFFTTKEVGKGTGLGLAISYGIIEKHNGTITVDSELNKGTTFEIKLPINTKLKNGV
ncbi:MAG: two-component system NtrC family sensor kinase, partial [Bacteroidia bacterium]